MKILVTYQSKTGFTKKYAEWIAEDLSCDLKELSKVNASIISEYDLMIHGGWIMGGMVNGLEKVKGFQPKKLIVFAVGFTTKENVDMNKEVEANKLADTPFFYYEGGTDPKKMGFMGRTMVKMVTKKKVEYVDLTSRDAIKELVKLVKDM